MMTNEQDFEILREQLASIEHARWSHWQSYMHGKCSINSDGSLTIPKALAEKWEKQYKTEYSELTDREKESDREQVDKYLPLIKKFISKKTKKP